MSRECAARWWKKHRCLVDVRLGGKNNKSFINSFLYFIRNWYWWTGEWSECFIRRLDSRRDFFFRLRMQCASGRHEAKGFTSPNIHSPSEASRTSPSRWFFRTFATLNIRRCRDEYFINYRMHLGAAIKCRIRTGCKYSWISLADS